MDVGERYRAYGGGFLVFRNSHLIFLPCWISESRIIHRSVSKGERISEGRKPDSKSKRCVRNQFRIPLPARPGDSNSLRQSLDKKYGIDGSEEVESSRVAQDNRTETEGKRHEMRNESFFGKS